jgi:tetratricopeptide (TPR) repeat protein
MTQTTFPPTEPKRSRWPAPSRAVILIVGLIIVLPLTYALAWWDAYRLTVTYLEDADTSYDEARYLDALLGYEEFDDAEHDYVERGGYIQVRGIWENAYARPVPDQVRRAEERIDEIVYDRLTVEDAEQFVQANIGRNNPYMGLIYLRLGELYEADGRARDAEDIYESFPNLFPNEHELIERARADLERLHAQQTDG